MKKQKYKTLNTNIETEEKNNKLKKFLKLDNSKMYRLAIAELYKKHFGE
jgi:hypothetical protein